MEFVPVTECKMMLLKQTSIRNATINWTYSLNCYYHSPEYRYYNFTSCMLQ